MANRARITVDVSGMRQIEAKSPEEIDAWQSDVCEEMVAELKALINTSPPGRVYRRRNPVTGVRVQHVASMPDYPPNTFTGRLKEGIIHTKIRQYVYIVYTIAPWAIFTEYGTKRMGARPLFRPVADSWLNGRLERSFIERFGNERTGVFQRLVSGLRRLFGR